MAGLTSADRATLANVLRGLEEANDSLAMQFLNNDGRTPFQVSKAWNAIWYCEGRIRGLLAEPIPAREGE